MVIFVRFSDQTDDYFNAIYQGQETAYNGKTNGARFVGYYDDANNGRSFSRYMAAISGGGHAVKNIFPQYNEATGAVDVLTLSKVTYGEAKTEDKDTTVVKEVIEKIDLTPYESELDQDNDGRIDNVTIIMQADEDVKGSGGFEPTLRSHKLSLLDTYTWTDTSKSTNTFNMLNSNVLSGKRAGLIAHEYLHSLGYPDLYLPDDNNGDPPVGNWDMMAADARFMNLPLAYLRQHFSGWASVPEVEDVGANKTTNNDGSTTYEISLTAFSGANPNNAVMVTSPVNPYEKFVIELRERTDGYYSDDSLDGGIPVKSGVIVYRVNTTVEGLSNYYGSIGVTVFTATGAKDDNRSDAALGGTTINNGVTTVHPTALGTGVGNNIPITFADGMDSGIKVTDVQASGNGAATLKVTIPDWSAFDLWANSQGIEANASMVRLFDLDGQIVAATAGKALPQAVDFWTYEKGSWQPAGTALGTLTDRSSLSFGSLDLAKANGIVYAAYANGDGKAVVSAYAGGSWTSPVVVDTANNNQVSLGMVNDVPYIAYHDGASVKAAEVLHGGGALSVTNKRTVATGAYSLPAVLSLGGELVVGYRDNSNAMLFFAKASGDSFAQLGSPGAASSCDAITYNDELYFAAASTQGLTVSKYDAESGTWREYASNSEDSFAPALAVSQGNLYVVTGPATQALKGVYAYEVMEGKLVLEGLPVSKAERGNTFSLVSTGSTLIVGYVVDSTTAVVKEKVISNDLLSISVTPPTKTAYLEGDPVSYDGLEVTANYQRTTRTLKPNEYTVTGFATDTVGNHTATVTMNGTTESNTFAYKVSSRASTKKDPQYTAPAAATIEYGQPASDVMNFTFHDPDTGGILPGETKLTNIDENPDAGTYTAAWEFVPDDAAAYSTARGTMEVTVTQRELVPHVAINAKTYDGATTGEGSVVSLAGAVYNDQPTATATFEWDTKNADETNATAQVTLDPAWQKNYTLHLNGAVDIANAAPIAPAPLSVEWSGVEDRYAGDGKSVRAEIKDKATAVFGSDDVGLSLVIDGDPASDGGSPGKHTAAASLTGADQGNYELDGSAIRDYEVASGGSLVSVTNVKNGSKPTRDFVYGDTVTVEATVAPANAPATRSAFADPKDGEMALYCNGVQVSDPVPAAGSTYTMKCDTSSKLVPANGPVTLEARFVGDANMAGNSALVEISLAKKPLDVEISGASFDKTYDGTTDAPAGVELKVAATTPAVGADDPQVEGTVSYDSPDAGARTLFAKNVAVAGDAMRAWYTVSDPVPVSGAIKKAAPPVAAPRGELAVINGLAETVYEYNCQSDLGQLSPGQRWGDLAFDVIANNLRSPYKVDAKPAHVEGGILRVPIAEVPKDQAVEGGVGSIELKVTSGNFQDFTLTVDVRAVNAKTPKLDGAVSVVGSLTYGQPLDGLTLEATFVDPDTKAEVAGTLRWTAGQDPLPAGSRQVAWEFVPESPEYLPVSGTVAVEVAKKPVALAWSGLDGRVYGDGGSVVAATQDFVTGDAVQVALSFDGAPDEPTNAGTYAVTAALEGAAAGNYALAAPATRTLTIAPKPLTLSVAGAASKVYDGTTALPQDAQITLALVGVLPQDAQGVGFAYDGGAFARADAWTAEVVMSGVRLTGDPGVLANYTLPTSAAGQVAGGIAPATPTQQGAVTAGAAAAGSKLEDVALSGTFLGIDGKPLTGLLVWDDGAVVLEAGTRACAWTFVPDDANYAPVSGTLELTVAQKDPEQAPNGADGGQPEVKALPVLAALAPTGDDGASAAMAPVFAAIAAAAAVAIARRRSRC